MSLNHSPAIVTDGLVLCLDAANVRSYPKSGTTWSDLVGSNDGSFVNMTSSNYSGDNGGVLNFDGADEHINLGSTLNTDDPLSVCCWFKMDQERRYQGLVTRSAASSFPNFILYTSNLDGAGGFGTYIGAHRRVLGVVNINTWYYGCFTLDSTGNLNLYLNGSLIKSDTSVSMNYASSNDILIGEFQSSTGGDYPHDGMISSVSIYNRALTGDEVRQNYEATVGRYT